MVCGGGREGEADYADFIRKMNEQVKHYKQEVLPRRRKGRSTGSGDEAGEGRNPATAGKPIMAKPGDDAAKPGDGDGGKRIKPGGRRQTGVKVRAMPRVTPKS